MQNKLFFFDNNKNAKNAKLLFDFCPVKMQEKTNFLVRKHKIIRFMFRNNLLRKNTVGESGAPSLLQKENRRSAKFDVSKVLFPNIGKITNHLNGSVRMALSKRERNRAVV